MSIEDWNREFGELVRRGANEPGDIAPAAGEQVVENDVPVADVGSDQAMAERRLSIAARLVELGFITADRATPDNPAVEVLGELLPPDAELGLCLTCHGFSSSAPYPFAETAGVFPNRGSFRMTPALAEVSPHGPALLTAPRRELVVCTQVALSWTASRVRQRPPGCRHAVFGSVSRHCRRDSAPPAQRCRRGVGRGRPNAVLPRHAGGRRRAAGAHRPGGTVAVISDAAQARPARPGPHRAAQAAALSGRWTSSRRTPRWGYPELMTRDEAIAEVERRRAAEPGASWIATHRDGDWIVVRVGVAPTKVTGTATKPPPVAPQDDPHSAIERAAWFAGGGG